MTAPPRQPEQELRKINSRMVQQRVADQQRRITNINVAGIQGAGSLSNPELSTETANDKLMLTVLGAIAEFERELMLERQSEGVARARAQGKYKGRKPTARAKSAEVIKMKAEGRTADAIAEALNISRASVFRILREKYDPT